MTVSSRPPVPHGIHARPLSEATQAWRRIDRISSQRMRPLLLRGVILLLALTLSAVLTKKVRKWHRCHQEPGDDADGFSDPIYPRPVGPYKSISEISRTPDACSEAFDFPQIALLYLTKGTFPHELLWREWFLAAAGKVPARAVRAEICNHHPHRLHEIQMNKTNSSIAASCGGGGGGGGTVNDVIARQHLFDVWIHPSPSFSGFPEGSIFRGCELPPKYRTEAVWGTHTLVDATRTLLAAALTNSRATKFVLISESDIPLYSPLVLYEQLIRENRSRINACNTSTWWSLDEYRLRSDMVEAGLPPTIWRKSSQWVALSRPHAQQVVTDERFDTMFRTLCRRKWDASWCDYRVCYSDEHYIPTLLASLGEDQGQTDCTGELTAVDWSRGAPTDAHPHHYAPSEVSPGLLKTLRREGMQGCEYAATAASSAASQFLDAENILVHLDRDSGVSSDVGGDEGATALMPNRSLLDCEEQQGGKHEIVESKEYELLGSRCPLMARKFTKDAVEAVLAAVVPCASELFIIQSSPQSCRGQAAARYEKLLSDMELSPNVESNCRGKNNNYYYYSNSSDARVVRGLKTASFVGAVVGIGWAVWKHRRRRRLPLAHRDGFHTILRSRGIIE